MILVMSRYIYIMNFESAFTKFGMTVFASDYGLMRHGKTYENTINS